MYLRYYKDQTQSEVAERLGISQVQVSRLEKKILKQIQMQMDQKDS
ncbi:RNA polymerase sigma-F factor [Bacillus safensis FO-36b] [Bacillus safensis subsp. safensis]